MAPGIMAGCIHGAPWHESPDLSQQLIVTHTGCQGLIPLVYTSAPLTIDRAATIDV